MCMSGAVNVLHTSDLWIIENRTYVFVYGRVSKQAFV